MRRTTTIDMRWAEGWGSELLLEGRGRDLLTPVRGPAVVTAESAMRLGVQPDRSVAAIETSPAWPGVGDLLGARAGSGFRARLAEVLPEGSSTDPLHLLLDDVPGATLISGFAFAQWHPIEDLLADATTASAGARPMTGICTGFMPGSSSLAPDGTSRWTHRTRPVAPLERAHDVLAWHELQQISEVSMRRARRIDVWLDARATYVDAMFQDTSTRPEGGRVAVHEYTLTATAEPDPGTGALVLTSVDPVPHVLPYAECPLAVLNAGSLAGTPLADLRAVVLERLTGVAGCTHLNDALRALADVPHLAAAVSREASASPPTPER
jgi:hypothetical protein